MYKEKFVLACDGHKSDTSNEIFYGRLFFRFLGMRGGKKSLTNASNVVNEAPHFSLYILT